MRAGAVSEPADMRVLRDVVFDLEADGIGKSLLDALS
jgi:hypothetical protein